MEEIYTVDEVASYLKLKPETIRVMLRQGKIKGIKVSRDWRIRKSDLQLFISGETNDDK